MNIFRVVFLILFVLFAGIATYFGEELIFPERGNFPKFSLESEIEFQLSQLNLVESDQPTFQFRKAYLRDHRVKKVEIDWNKIFSRYFYKNSQSKMNLEIDIFDSNEEAQKPTTTKNIIIQLSLVEDVSQNKIWESSFTVYQPNPPKKN